MRSLNLQALKNKDVYRKTVGRNVTDFMLPIVGVYAMQYALIILL